MEGGGRVGEYVGGYTDWLRQRNAGAPAIGPTKGERSAPLASALANARAGAGAAANGGIVAPRTVRKRRLTFKETQELAALPERIDVLERERAELYASLANPALLRSGSAIVETKTRLEGLETELAAAIERWETLETIAAGA
jgi:ATP-binding cassette subfamily F protein uup